MNRPNYKLLLSSIPAMREVAAIRTRGARDEALRRARTDEERSSIESLFYDEVRQNWGWFEEQEAFLRACIELDEGKEVKVPRRTKKPTKRIIGAAKYDAVLSPLDFIGAVMGAVMPPEVQAIMLLVEGLIEGALSNERALVIGQIQAMVLDMYMRTEEASREDGARFKSSVKRALSP